MTPWRADAGTETVPSIDEDASHGSASNGTEPPPRLALARWLLSLRSRRPFTELREISGEPAWELLLSLYVSELMGRKTSVTSACISAGVPLTTALRHLNTLCDSGFVERKHDPDDARRIWVILPPRVFAEISTYLQAVAGDFPGATKGLG
jgi:hypothetical protein